MIIEAGSIIISSPSLQDPNFEKTVIVIGENNEKGAVGFVINKLFPRKLNELVEFKNCAAFDLHTGGPVDTENLFVLHQRPELIADSTHLFGNVFMGGNFKQVIQNINDGTISNDDIKLFIGYCGWDKNELETEVKEGSWLIVSSIEEIIFTTDETLWEKLIAI